METETQKQADFLNDITKTHIEKKDFTEIVKALEQTISKVKITNELIDAKQIAMSDLFESIAICLVINIREKTKNKKQWDTEKNRVGVTEVNDAPEQNKATAITCKEEESDYEEHLQQH